MSPMPTVTRLGHRSPNADNFARANGALAGSGWATLATAVSAMNVSSNVIVPGTGQPSANYRTGQFRNDQFAQATIAGTTLNSGDMIGLMLRAQIAGNAYLVLYYHNPSGQYQIVLMYMNASGTTTVLTSVNLGTSPLAANA